MPYTQHGTPFSGLSPATRSTSYAAAAQVADKAETQRARVLAAILETERIGFTDTETQEYLDMPGNTERPRRRELQDAGLIVALDKKRTVNGRACIVWVGVQYAPKVMK